jgi:RNA 3'-terminal phosphate cyclase (ATP)
MKKMISIDGSLGEGGGQILRTALGLSLVCGQPFHIKNIRANRKKPGLMRQHLTAVHAAMEIGNGSAEGAAIGSKELVFTPGAIRAGSYRFSIGTAGSCTLVLQAILPALLMADKLSKVTLEGGTHNPMAPPFDFLETTFLPLLSQMGAEVIARLDRPGFFPAGGGRMTITVTPQKKLHPIELLTVSPIRFSARAVCAQLPGHIGERELQVVKNELGVADDDLDQVQLDDFGPGNILTIFAHSDQLTETFTGFGRKNVRAEKVALEAVEQARSYSRTAAPVGPYLADQLLIPMALAGSGCFLTGRPTRHTLTNIKVIQHFLGIEIAVVPVGERHWRISMGE